MSSEVVNILQKGEAVALPTDTVYGMVVDASNAKAIETLYDLKARPDGRPFQVLVNSLEMADSLAQFDKTAFAIAKKFWPGPLTLALPIRSNEIIDLSVCGNLYTIGLRWPDHDPLCDIIEALGSPLAASSANVAGEMPMKTAQEIRNLFSDLHVVDGEASGMASTVAELRDGKIIVYREGQIRKKQLEACVNS